ncbi:MAG: squalene/phytoene synthase family protein [Acidithiobacillales bacterium]
MATLESLLEKTSRTFALSIPVLPEPTRREVTIAYLLFRIADTFEDASHWSPAARIAALADFAALLPENRRDEAVRLSSGWSAAGPAKHEGYRQLIAEVPFVLDAFFGLSREAIEPIRRHVTRSADGMAETVRQTGGAGLELSSLPELKRYCYCVAGIVGEMLTELFLLGRPSLEASAGALRERAATFGEALQLVNILKDADDDAAEGRRYLPAGVSTSEVFALARKDLAVAREYIRLLQEAGAPRGIVEFCALPVALAVATLDKVEAKGPGAKVSRPELFVITQRVKRALDRGELPVPQAGAAGRV